MTASVARSPLATSGNHNLPLTKWKEKKEQEERERESEAEAKQKGAFVDEFKSRTPDSQDSAVGEYFVYGGRTYNNILWAYRFPADQEEIIRLDRQHYILSATLPGLYCGPVEEVLAPVPAKNRRLLDVGCGTGIWLAEMAERFPDVDCVGIDITNIQHDHHLRNCTYMTVEAPRRLHIFPDRSFDVIHIRQMLASIHDFPELLRECFRLLRPEGLMLLHEPALQLYSAWSGYKADELAPAMSVWMQTFRRALEYRRVHLGHFDNVDGLLENAGFDREQIHLHVTHRSLCLEDQTSVLTQNEIAHFYSFLHASRLMVLESGQLSAAAYDQLQEDACQEFTLRGRGPAGPLGASGLVSSWGYWWVRKTAASPVTM